MRWAAFELVINFRTVQRLGLTIPPAVLARADFWPIWARTVPAPEWTKRATLIAPNSDLGVAHLNGEIYVVGGYPSTRISADTV